MAGAKIKKSARRNVLQRDGYKCRYCGVALREDKIQGGPHWPNSATLDHVVPKDKGGTNAQENLVACCLSCNQSKSNRVYPSGYTLGDVVFGPIVTTVPTAGDDVVWVNGGGHDAK